MNTRSLIAAATIALTAAIAVPAAARTVAPPAPVPTSTDTPSPTQRICVVDTPTGSLVTRKVCRTRAEWNNMGMDPLAKK
ncbi:hypothetical protein [Sphingomonas sp. 67-36]|mgnify:CR=1 FL=1|uniref:hypothetical protein n=1 Tax=Sphingomonas sp. 67-36 TaxID=1895849 RepID=UPI000926B65A|nr:hypothetical protein [Sphingomonas sp. 67-36]MBS0283227.1 hypothetical protein [Pseudomonadota bacterium]OJV31858.1 MAG: hypothetical protein BGO24_15475 [Sphingomonas sp. 67-36]